MHLVDESKKQQKTTSEKFERAKKSKLKHNNRALLTVTTFMEKNH
jgi:hypothetical protein